MSAQSGPYGRIAPVTPPLRGSFPLDHEKACHIEMLDYLWCLHSNKFKNDQCRGLARQYFECRMDKGLMDRDEFPKLGYSNDDEPSDELRKWVYIFTLCTFFKFTFLFIVLSFVDIQY